MPAKFFFGSDSVLSELTSLYFEKLSVRQDYLFNEFDANASDFLLSVSQCRKIREITYLSPPFPFGKIDQYTKVGEVEYDSAEIVTFNHSIRNALSLIQASTIFWNMLKTHIKCFVPLRGSEGAKLRENGSGSSMHWFKGGVFLSIPRPSEHAILELCLNIVHELGHQCLMIYQDCDPLITNGLDFKVYSVIRKTHRPAILSFHALVAVYFMIHLISEKAFLENLNFNDTYYLNKRKSELLNQFVVGSYSLKHVPWTSLGSKIFSEMFSSIIRNHPFDVDLKKLVAG